ncbi:sensor histidine kinase, partial [Undibacterium sp.]|uniref:sensor histidine kinase n=1 Tax=Undibacterium sp. TaxID=1914977 RepID=UPI00374CDD32
RRFASQVKKRLEERQSERERIARELHDTFLQTVYALILKIDNVFHRLPVDEPVKAELERSLNLAEQAFSEARDCVKELRTSLHEQQQFVVAVTAIVSGAFTGPTRLVTQSSGTLRRFKLPVFEELYAIAREALLNAARHARASEVVFKVTYGTDAFTMLIVDDGKGIDADVLKAGQRSGHYGLPGMRERAVQIGAAFSITSTEQDGTRIRLILPARLAYEAELRG